MRTIGISQWMVEEPSVTPFWASVFWSVTWEKDGLAVVHIWASVGHALHAVTSVFYIQDSHTKLTSITTQ